MSMQPGGAAAVRDDAPRPGKRTVDGSFHAAAAGVTATTMRSIRSE